MKHLLLSGLIGTALLVGCKKDDATPAATSAKTSALLNKRWGLTALSAQQGSVIEDGFAQLRPCEKDNYLRFNEDHSAEVNEGVAKCDAADPQTYAGKWELVDNESKLLLTTPLFGNGGGAVPEIIELSTTRMVLRGTLIDNGVTTTYTATLTPY